MWPRDRTTSNRNARTGKRDGDTVKAVVQRVSSASVEIAGETVGRIGRGLLVLLGVGRGDGDGDASWMADKVAGLRVFEDGDSKMNLSVEDVKGAVLAVSQFTLLGDSRKGKRPSFVEAAPPEIAEKLYEAFVDRLRSKGIETATGRFRAHMEVALVNDGPVTLILESPR